MVLLRAVCVKSVSENIGPNSPSLSSEWCLVYWLYTSINKPTYSYKKNPWKEVSLFSFTFQKRKGKVAYDILHVICKYQQVLMMKIITTSK